MDGSAGDAALLDYTRRFDRVALTASGLAVTEAELVAAERAVGATTMKALRYAAQRIERFHRESAPRSWRMTDALGQDRGSGQCLRGHRQEARLRPTVDIDMIAGPSEILVINDGSATRRTWPPICSPRPSTTSWPPRCW